MDIRVNPYDLGLGAYQIVIALLGIAIFVFLTWRMLRAVQRRRIEGNQLGQQDWFALAWPPVLWAAVMVALAIIYTTTQAFGPRITLPKTDLTVTAPDSDARVKDLSPKNLTDEQRLEQQRKLERETKGRVDLDK